MEYSQFQQFWMAYTQIVNNKQAGNPQDSYNHSLTFIAVQQFIMYSKSGTEGDILNMQVQEPTQMMGIQFY